MSEGKKCPYCAENIDANANKCEFCNEAITGTTASSKDPKKWFLSLDIKSKAIVAFACLLAGVFLIMLFCGGGPCIDCSSNKAYKESAQQIVDYINNEGEYAYLSELIQNNDQTPEEKAEYIKYYKLKSILGREREYLPDYFVEDIHGMSVDELLDYVDKNTTIHMHSGWVQINRK